MLKYQMANICYELFEKDIDWREATLRMIFFWAKIFSSSNDIHKNIFIDSKILENKNTSE